MKSNTSSTALGSEQSARDPSRPSRGFGRVGHAILIATFCALPIAIAPAPVIAQDARNPQKTQTSPNLPSLGDTEREDLSPLMERKLGEQIMLDIRRDPDYLNDAPLLEYLNNFGNGLVAARPEARGEAGFDFFFFAVRDPMLNAFALPGGFIAVHSALLLAAQSESELASVMSHEIGHVAQRHIARMLGQQRQDSLIPLAAMVLAVLASRVSPEAPMGAIMGGQGLALQRQLNFSREAEREADRVGFQILRDAGFDTTGMVAFFGRMQTASRSYTDSVPAYLRSHPLTTERIADIEARVRDQRYRQREDSLDFHLIRARVRVLQDESVLGLRETSTAFENQLAQKNRLQTAAAKYGLALIAMKQGAFAKAQALLQEARVASASGNSVSAKSASSAATAQNSILESLAIDIKMMPNQADGALQDALKLAQSTHARFPLSRGIAHQYADALIAAGRNEAAVRFLRDQVQLYRGESELQDKLAKTYAAQGMLALQHMALAESYVLTGGLPAALDQLALARRSPDASFYDQAVIDARERELQARRRDELKDAQKSR